MAVNYPPWTAMDTLYLNKVLPRQYKKSDRLFYDRFRYCAKVNVKAATALRNLPVDSLTSALTSVDHNFRIQLRHINYGGNWRSQYSSDDASNQRTLINLVDFVECLYPYINELHLIVYPNWAYVYCNDVALCQTLCTKPYVLNSGITEIEIDRPRGTVRVPCSNYKQRSYFKERWIPNEKMVALKSFLLVQKDIKICASLKRALDEFPHSNKKNFWLQRHHHFDHNDPKIGFMIEMIIPGLIRQTVNIIDK